jgi:hypothetical protein
LPGHLRGKPISELKKHRDASGKKLHPIAVANFGGSPGEEFVQNEHRRKRQSQCTHENVNAG